MTGTIPTIPSEADSDPIFCDFCGKEIEGEAVLQEMARGFTYQADSACARILKPHGRVTV